MTPSYEKYDAVVCGAGIAGIAGAHALTQIGLKRVLIADPRPPLSLTSDKSTECYRNWWPGPGDDMVALMNRSIDLMESHAKDSDNVFLLNRRGYLFATANPEMADKFALQASEAESLGAGPLRHITNGALYRPASAHGFENGLDGADLITDKDIINAHFPYINPEAVAVLHARRCGSLSAQQMGMYLLERTRENGGELFSAELIGVETSAGRVTSVVLEAAGDVIEIRTDNIVLSTGPYMKVCAALLGIDLPVAVEKHIKISLSDPYRAVPREAPLIFWADPITLSWSNEEKEALSQSDDTQYLLEEFPAGVHGRPVGAGDQVLMYWPYDCELNKDPIFPLEWDPYLPDITLRGMARLVPGLERYFDPMPKPYVDGGYYTKTQENRPLIGPLRVSGAYVCAAFSGFGIMASCASGELLAKHITGDLLPHYANAFNPARYSDPEYCKLLETWDSSGQL
jgi:glycine/D-amino acid oxidase-like deaminating enzyme